MCLYVNSTNKDVQANIENFLIEDFFQLPPVSMTPVVHFALRIASQIFEKIWNGPNAIFKGLEKTDLWQKPEVENLVALSL